MKEKDSALSYTFGLQLTAFKCHILTWSCCSPCKTHLPSSNCYLVMGLGFDFRPADFTSKIPNHLTSQPKLARIDTVSEGSRVFKIYSRQNGWAKINIMKSKRNKYQFLYQFNVSQLHKSRIRKAQHVRIPWDHLISCWPSL